MGVPGTNPLVYYLLQQVGVPRDKIESFQGSRVLRNDDLQKAVESALVKAQLSICRQFLEDPVRLTQITDDEVQWLRRRVDKLQSDLAALYEFPVTALASAKASLQSFNDLLGERTFLSDVALVQLALAGELAPPAYVSLMTAELNDRMLSFFLHEIQTNPVVSEAMHSIALELGEPWFNVKDRVQKWVPSLYDLKPLVDKTAEVTRPSFHHAPIPRPEDGPVMLPSRNPLFIGRESLLVRIHDAFSSTQAQPTIVLTGLAGVGKTQLALEYAHRSKEEYSAVLWVRATERAVLASDFIRLSGSLGFRGLSPKNEVGSTQRLRDWLEQNGRWLLVFDGADDPIVLQGLLPLNTKGHVLITSRNTGWRSMASMIAVTEMTDGEAVALLQGATSRSSTGDVRALASALGYLPLALVQAERYMSSTGINEAQYLEHLREMRRAYAGDVEAPATVAAVSMALEQLPREYADFLKFLSVFAPDDIPLKAIKDGADLLPESLQRVVSSERLLREALDMAQRYSLVQGSSDMVSLHPLINACLWDLVPTDHKRAWVKVAIRLLDRSFPFEPGQSEDSYVQALIIPHALSVSSWAERLGQSGGEIARLLSKVGLTLARNGDYTSANSTLERVLSSLEAEYGPNHPETASGIANLAGIRLVLGDLTGARMLFERALSINESIYGHDHVDVSRLLVGLGDALFRSEDTLGAQSAWERALAIDERIYAGDHPQIAEHLVNLSAVKQELGEYVGARAFLERALAIEEGFFGPHHYRVANVLNNLGALTARLGQLSQAHAYLTRALEIEEAVYGVDAPELSSTLSNLGMLLGNMGDSTGANRFFARAQQVLETDGDRALASGSPGDYADLYAHLAEEALRADRLDEAREWYRTASELYERLGRTPDVLRTLQSLGSVSERMAQYDDAQRWFRKALRLVDTLQENELNIAAVNGDTLLAALCQHLGRLAHRGRRHADAEQWYVRGLTAAQRAGDAKILPLFMHNIGIICQEQKRYHEAERWYRDSIRIWKISGNRQGLAETLFQLGRVTQEQRQFAEAVRWYQRSLKESQAVSDDKGVILALYQLGVVDQQQGNRKGARRYYSQALELAERVGDRDSVAKACHQLGLLAIELGKPHEAEKLLTRSLAIVETVGDREGQAATLTKLAAVAMLNANQGQAESLLRRAYSLYIELKDHGGIELVLEGLKSLGDDGGRE